MGTLATRPERRWPIVAKDDAVHSSTFTLASADGLALFVYRWLPEATPKAVVQIAHGLIEHAGRYARLAEALTRAGYAIYAAEGSSATRLSTSGVVPPNTSPAPPLRGWRPTLGGDRLIARPTAFEDGGGWIGEKRIPGPRELSV
jgi:hypothetical protein